MVSPHKTLNVFSSQKWAFYFGKSADFLFRISVWKAEFCVVANRGRAFFGAWLRSRTFYLQTKIEIGEFYYG